MWLKFLLLFMTVTAWAKLYQVFWDVRIVAACIAGLYETFRFVTLRYVYVNFKRFSFRFVLRENGEVVSFTFTFRFVTFTSILSDFRYVFVLRENGRVVSFTFTSYVKMGRSFRLRFRLTSKWGGRFIYVYVLRFFKKKFRTALTQTAQNCYNLLF